MNWNSWTKLPKTTITIDIPQPLLDAIQATNLAVHRKELDKNHQDFQIASMLYGNLEELALLMRKSCDKNRFAEALKLWDQLQEAVFNCNKQDNA